MSDRVRDRIRESLGVEPAAAGEAGPPRLEPVSTDAVAGALALATEEGWQVRVEGNASWLPPDAPADLVLATTALGWAPQISRPDLIATASAGTTLAALTYRLAQDGLWLPWDPPGPTDRTVGSILATGTAGALRHGFGPPRDHILGCTLVCGDGRIVRPGGAVVKNVAGYDLTRLQVGSFGAFGIVTEAHLRLRARPAADATLLAEGARDELTKTARELLAAGLDAAALELLSPDAGGAADWTLAARVVGSAEGVAAESERCRAAGPGWRVLGPEHADAFWLAASRAASAAAVTLRLGVLLDGLDDTLDLVGKHLDRGLVAAGAGSGSIRWSGEATAEAIRALRHAAAGREIPLTLERAPWALRRVVGHFGAYREGVGGLVGGLRSSFDPSAVLVVALEGVSDE